MRGENKIKWAVQRLATSLDKIDKRQKAIIRAQDHIDKLYKQMEEDIEEASSRGKVVVTLFDEYQTGIEEHVATKIRHGVEAATADKKRVVKQMKRMSEELETLRANQALFDSDKSRKEDKEHRYDLSRATTLAIFDSIIAAIGNWSSDGLTAPDFELLFQSILFPLVYEPVMMGDSDYYLETVPTAALEVVKRGREFVQHYREIKDVSITEDTELWRLASVELLEWISNDALPMIYGTGSEDWAFTKPLPVEDMLKWRDLPASRVLEFPLIFDGMELIGKMGDEIRDHSGLPEFNKQQLTTRIEL